MDSRGFQRLSRHDRRELLDSIVGATQLPPELLEKDIWVVQTLSVLFQAPFGADLVFKGGTSLSKAHQAIRRFSEDVDVTYDIRRFVPGLVDDAGEEALPPTRSQEQRWTRIIRPRLVEWARDEALPALAEGMTKDGWAAKLRAEGDRIYLGYDPLFGDYGFVRPEVIVEFGARSTGEPRERRLIECDAARFVPAVSFPTARPSVMLVERTFWEKATAIHVFCRRARHRGNRLSRHWHDLVRLDDGGYVEKALADRELARAVAHHKAIFFREKDVEGDWIDYMAAVTGHLQLIPDRPLYDILAEDYRQMQRSGMLPEDAESFEDMMNRCAGIETRANER
ncbi:MAG: nucleotidyl transferase AbiEii/AbiGii toxin family protein [Gemmatimonadetes bacterium]|nr:nucleotidyl transferase AbiEii/AbiGii toxin family protein [Gemmatimonadota bacterium]MYA41024.1 nucleotidyl transferase AbiEii/AbiGii toxin family protein [Gemmatimonadota bacterium]MYE95316.1 nucleotidyl transferase AbiEii/AbiGii toxin family protein [Gemmatimonadota bacterium]MYJ09138.1 nucleotidyl transferase AbiEii/AbiGii toxin family protein [Gemmatimonadota bacterium]